MIRHLLVTSVSALGLLAAAPALAEDETTTPTMDFGTWGVGLEGIDDSVDPGDDFNAYVNGRWVAENTIPADRTRFGAFDMLREGATHDVEALVAELVASNPAPGTPERRIVDAYNAYLDTAAIDATGLTPAYPYLDEIFSAPDLGRLVELFETPGYPALVTANVSVDRRNPNEYAVSVGFDGMGLPDRDYYLVDSEQNLTIRAAYMDYLTFLMGQANYADPRGAAEAVYAFEHQVAELEWARNMLRIPTLTYNELSPDELRALAPGFPVDRLLATAQMDGQPRYLASQLPPTADEIEALGLTEAQLAQIGGGLPAMMELLTQTPLATLQAWMAAQFLSNNASVLTSELDAANFAFFGTTLSGTEQQQERWKRAIAATESQLGEQLGALYVERYFPPEAKEQMDELVANLQRAMRADIAGNEWMTQETIAQATAKIDSFTPMIGYPAEFESYDGLVIAGDDPLGNRVRTIAWDMADSLAHLGQPVDRSEWGMFPQTVNAYYSPVFNQIVFPAAILQPPFFNFDADPAVNYGAIGAVIGHEIGHGFDDSGSQYDATGTLRNWWQPEDRAGFEEQTARLQTMIEAYCPSDNGELCLRGPQSMGETLGDVVGLQMAYHAYRLSLNGAEAPVIDGLTGDQRFFLGFAQIWRAMMRPEALRNLILTDSHPPGEFRLNNAVRHIDAWYEAFDVGPDDALYLPPEERIQIW